MSCKRGLIKVLISAIIIHTNIALIKLSTSIPGTIQDTKIIKIAYTTHLIKIFIIL